MTPVSSSELKVDSHLIMKTPITRTTRMEIGEVFFTSYDPRSMKMITYRLLPF
jgi:hypothetical protein